MYKLKDSVIFDDETGEIISKNTSPKFVGWKYDDYYNEFIDNKEIRFLEPMTAKELKPGQDIPEDSIAEEKFDGHRALCYFTRNGNRFFSRRISKKSNWYAENTDCLPHLRDFITTKGFVGTVLDGEITMATFTDVQGVTGALPETAIANQVDKGFATFNAFDILYYKGINVQAMPLWKRKVLLARIVLELKCPHIKFSPIFTTKEVAMKFLKLISGWKQAGFGMFPIKEVPDYKTLCQKVWERGGEGLMLKDINSRYEQKRSSSMLKMKDCIYRDVVIMEYEPPTREFDGKTDLGLWDYWEGKTAVTKPYAKGWVGAITCGVYREIGNCGDMELVPVVSLKGFTDEEQEYIKANREKLIGTVLEVKAQMISDSETGTLRHPRFSRWRPDKNADTCIWEDHIQ